MGTRFMGNLEFQVFFTSLCVVVSSLICVGCPFLLGFIVGILFWGWFHSVMSLLLDFIFSLLLLIWNYMFKRTIL